MFSCIEKYPLNSQDDFIPLVVIDGTISDLSESQAIRLSMSSQVDDERRKPLSDCIVIVEDKNGNTFDFTEDRRENGSYICTIPMYFLVSGNQFKIHFITPNGNEYESDFEEMLSCQDIDSVYFILKQKEVAGVDEFPKMGLQFYVRSKIDNFHSKYYRWDMAETYEYQSTWPIEKFWDGKWKKIPPDFSKFYCYKTSSINQIYTASGMNLQPNAFMSSPLHFVDNTTQKLYFRYSLLVRQQSLTETAYYFLEILRGNNQESGGLYDKQPSNVTGNVKCLTNPGEKVLGYFFVSSIRSKRIFVEKVEGLVFTDDLFCKSDYIEFPDFILKSEREDWPIYVAPSPDGRDDDIFYAPQSCFDCTLKGGTLKKPSFW